MYTFSELFPSIRQFEEVYNAICLYGADKGYSLVKINSVLLMHRDEKRDAAK